MSSPTPFHEIPGGIKTSNRLGVMTIAGLIGGVIGFALSHIPGDGKDSTSLSELRHHTGLWFMFIVVGIGAGLIAGNSYLDGKPPSGESLLVAVPALLVGGYVSGYLAQMIFTSMLDDAALQSCADSNSSWCVAYAIPRAVAWLVAGGLGGLAVGASFRSRKRIQNGVLGGLAGGLIGGALFDVVPVIIGRDSEAASQVIGICLISTLMGLLISMIDTARTAMWLEVISGEMRGRQFLIMEQTTTVGSARTANVTLVSDRQIKEVHVTITQASGRASFTCAMQAPVLLNGFESHGANLSNGDVLRIGNTDLRAGFRQATGTASYPPPPPNGAGRPPDGVPRGRPTASDAAANPGGDWTSSRSNPPPPPGASRGPASAPPQPTSRPRLPTKPTNN
ncbi:MAG: hypothetical protein F2789_12740 [Actinobacteria bacterium]|nr:hypothetical protein [Actinomycetota bacterium]